MWTPFRILDFVAANWTALLKKPSYFHIYIYRTHEAPDPGETYFFSFTFGVLSGDMEPRTTTTLRDFVQGRCMLVSELYCALR